MNRQDGRCTAAYESKAYPYFTFNTQGVQLDHYSWNTERMALLQRLKFVARLRGVIDILEVEVDDAGRFHTDDVNAIDLLMALIKIECGIQYVSWVKHEAL